MSQIAPRPHEILAERQTKPNGDTTPEMPLFVFEDYHTLPLKPIGALFGVPVLATPKAWLNPFMLAPIMLIGSFIVVPGAGLFERVLLTAFWAFLALVASFIHSIGHILSGKAAGAPMDKLIVTMSRQPNIYEGDQDQYPPRVHILRAMGGPAANLSVALIAGIALLAVGYTPSLFVFAAMNLGFGLGALAPVPSVDGEVIARYLRMG